jgi:hypothetical protein
VILFIMLLVGMHDRMLDLAELASAPDPDGLDVFNGGVDLVKLHSPVPPWFDI